MTFQETLSFIIEDIKDIHFSCHPKHKNIIQNGSWNTHLWNQCKHAIRVLACLGDWFVYATWYTGMTNNGFSLLQYYFLLVMCSKRSINWHLWHKCASRNRQRERLPEQKLLGISVLWNMILQKVNPWTWLRMIKEKKWRAKFNFLGTSKALEWVSRLNMSLKRL